jgi:class 3 adenylate cyclase
VSSPHAYAGLLPILLRRELTTAGARPSQPSWHRLAGAALIADVSGFTTLAERLTARGPEGVEELSRLVNRWFGAMVDVIEAHGGDLVRFAGDAPIVVFPAGSDDGLPDAVARALACAQALQFTMRDLQTADAPISIRSGIGAGDLTAAIVGGINDCWEYVVGGDPLEQMADAQRRAPPGGHVLSPQAEAQIARRPVGPSVVLEPLHVPVAGDDVVRAFVAPSVLQLIDAGHSSWMAELRRATVMFLAIRGIDMDAATGPARLHESLRRLQAAVFDAGGAILQFLVDDKGLTLVAAWGVSGHRHEDDALRAVRAALRCRTALDGTGASLSGGLATGRVFCGWRGHDRRREYALIGSVVNRAARLMMTTTDRLRCDAATAQAGAAAAEFGDSGRLLLKGSADPVQTYELRALDESADAPARDVLARRPVAADRMVGRHGERSALLDALALVAGGSSATVLVRGEPGMGKSTLLSAFMTDARADQAAVAVGSVESASSAGPYLHWRTVVASLLGIDRIAGAERLAALGEALSLRPDLEPFAPLIAEVLGLPVADSDLTLRIVQQARVEKTTDLIVNLLQEAAARAPLVVVFDNVQWADSLSIGLMRAAARRVARLLLVVGTRPLGAAASSELTDLLAEAARTIDLSRLDREDVRRLVCHRLGVTHVPDELVAVIEERAAGYPLFAGELAQSLLDAGVLQTSGSACVLVDDGARLRLHRLPDSVQDAIADRLDRTSPTEQMTMKVASAIGSPFDVGTLEAVHPLQPTREQLEGVVDALANLGFLVRRGASVEFGHAVMQDVAYGVMLTDQRRALHRAIGAWYERVEPPPVAAALMAHHWIEAGDPGRSVVWLERAGEQASRLGAVRETLRHLNRAFDIAEQTPAERIDPMRRIRWLRLTAHAYSELGAMDESTRRLHTALGLLGGRLPTSTAAMGLRLGRESVRQAALLSGVLRARARSANGASGRTLEEAEVLRLLGKLAFFAQDHLRYITISLQAINVAERAGARETAASAYAALGYVVAMLGLEKLATRWWRLADASGELDAQLNMLIGRMMFLNSHARWDESLRAADAQAQLIARLGTSASMPSHLMIRGYIDLHHGRYRSAVAHIEQLLDWCLSVNHLQQAFAMHLQLCGVLLEEGRLEDVRRHLAEADALSARVADPLFLSIYHGTAVHAQLAAGDLAAAEPAAEALRAVIARSSPYFGDMEGYVALTEYFLARQRGAGAAEARSLIHQARWAHAALRKHAGMNPYARPRLWLLDGRIAAAEGRARHAHRSWRRSLDLATRYGMPREVAHAHAELALDGSSPAGERLRHLAEARRRYAEMGSLHLLVRLDESAAPSAPS